jgi:hypothetical protein
MTPSPVMRPLPVLQALRTTKSAFNLRLRISSAVSKALSLPDGASAIAFASRLLRSQAENQEATWVRIF